VRNAVEWIVERMGVELDLQHAARQFIFRAG
jgi:hypothetical protein